MIPREGIVTRRQPKNKPVPSYPYCLNPKCAGDTPRKLIIELETIQRRCPNCGSVVVWSGLKSQDKKRFERMDCKHDWKNFYEPGASQYAPPKLATTCIGCGIRKEYWDAGWNRWHL